MIDTACVTDGLRAWFAVQVWTGRERLSADHLCARGCEVFLPRFREQRRWSDRIKTIDRALFDGYLFCRINAETLGKVLKSPGVIRIVGDGRQPLPVPAHQIDTIRRVLDERLGVEPWPFVRAGHRVCIEQGPLRGTEGFVVTAKNQQRLVVSITLLQRSVAVELDREWLRVVSPLTFDAASTWQDA